MRPQETVFGRKASRHALALLACAALLYFAAGGSLFHQHTNAPDTACHICQALHMPALAPAAAAAIAIPEFVSWYLTQPVYAAPCEAFSFHHAGRAPPVA